MKLLYVKWADSATHGGWVSKTDEFCPVDCESVGWLTKSTKRHIVLAQSRNEEQLSNLISIPRVAIIEMRRLKR